MSVKVERRRHPRKKVAVRSRISGKDTAKMECDTVDLSANGLCCMTEQPMDPFTLVQLTLEIPVNDGVFEEANDYRSVDCEGVVVRSELEQGKYQTAIFFNKISEAGVDLVKRYVALHRH